MGKALPILMGKDLLRAGAIIPPPVYFKVLGSGIK